MAKSLREYIQERSIIISQTIESLEKGMGDFPNGRIKIKKCKSGIYYYLSTKENTDKLLSKDDGLLIGKLLQKSYFQKSLQSLNCELDALKRIQLIYPKTIAEDLYDQLPDERRNLIKPIILGDERIVRKWLETPYRHKPFRQDAPEFYSLRGDRVRSKSEVIIADRLYAKGVPYKYECPIKVGNKIIHPDFSALKMSELKIVYLEHCGMMDDPKYADDLVRRINDYSEAGIILGDRLFLTFETADMPLDVRTVDRLIDSHFR